MLYGVKNIGLVPPAALYFNLQAPFTATHTVLLTINLTACLGMVPAAGIGAGTGAAAGCTCKNAKNKIEKGVNFCTYFETGQINKNAALPKYCMPTLAEAGGARRVSPPAPKVL